MKFFEKIKVFFMRIKVRLIFFFKLRPKIIKMAKYINKMANLRPDAFPMGKSIFKLPGTGDTVYFIMMRDESGVAVSEIFDEILNKVPERYQLLPTIGMGDLLS